MARGKSGKKSGKGGQAQRMAARRAAARGTGRLMPTTRARWLIDALQAPASLDPGALYELVVVEDERGVIRAMNLTYRPASPGQVVRVFREAMEKPLAGSRPERPAVMVARTQAVADQLAASAQSAGVVVRVDPAVRPGADFLRSFAQNGQPLSDGPLMGVGLEQEDSFAAAAAALAAQAPWKLVGDEYVFEVRPKDRPMALPFGVVLGSMQETFGLALYESLEDVAKLALVRDHQQQSMRTRSVALLLSPLDELQEEHVAIARHRGYVTPGDMVPDAVSIRDGGLAPRVEDAEAWELTTACRAIAGHFEQARGQGRSLVEASQVVVDGQPVEVRVHLPLEEMLDGSGLLPICDFPCIHMGAGISGATWGNAAGGAAARWPGDPDEVRPTLVIRAAKADVLGAAGMMGTPEAWSVLETHGTTRVMIHMGDALACFVELVDPVAPLVRGVAARQESLAIALVGGGAKRVPTRIKSKEAVRLLLLPHASAVDLAPALPSPFDPDERFVFEVSLDDVEPRIWRRFALPADASFGDLHECIQTAAGWQDEHLFQFTAGSKRRASVLAGSGGSADWFDDSDEPEAYETPLFAFFTDRRRRKCQYVYDFGDDWRVTVQLLKVEKHAGQGFEFLDGARAFPPEDSGGAWAYERLVATAESPELDPEFAEWLGDWDPDRVDADALRAAFAGYNL